ARLDGAAGAGLVSDLEALERERPWRAVLHLDPLALGRRGMELDLGEEERPRTDAREQRVGVVRGLLVARQRDARRERALARSKRRERQLDARRLAGRERRRGRVERCGEQRSGNADAGLVRAPGGGAQVGEEESERGAALGRRLLGRERQRVPDERGVAR